MCFDLIAMTRSQSELQASHESNIKKLQSEKKAVQKDLSTAKTRLKNLDEAKNRLDEEVYIAL